MIDILGRKHNVAFPTRLLAGEGGEHNYDIQLEKDHDNGEFVSRGDYIKLGTYKEAEAAAGFEGRIVEPANNGHFYVEVTALPAGKEILFLHQPVVSPYPEKQFQYESLWVNKAGSVIKGQALHIGDMVEEAVEGFNGTPEVGKTVTIENAKLKVADA